MARTILLRMTNEGLYYNPGSRLPLEHTNLPIGKFLFKRHYTAYWQVEMLTYREACLRVAVRESFAEAEIDLAAFDRQQARYPVERLEFAPFPLALVSEHLAYYEPLAFADLAPAGADRPAAQPAAGIAPGDSRLDDPVSPPAQAFAFTFHARLRQFRFGAGEATCVYTGRHAPRPGQPLRLSVKNYFLLPEFEYIKPFFARQLGNRRLEVSVSGQLRDGEISALTARCPAIEGIDASTVRIVRGLAVQQLSRFLPPVDQQVDKSLFTAEELFDATGQPDLGNALRLSDRELLEEILTDETIRNRAQLTYLAGQLQQPDRPIRFTLSPHFGFLFTVQGETMDHHIWELLNSHATYVWSFERERLTPRRQEQLLQQSIGIIREQGRDLYRRAVAQEATDYTLSVVRHEKASSAFVDGFPRWRVRLEECLV